MRPTDNWGKILINGTAPATCGMLGSGVQTMSQLFLTDKIVLWYLEDRPKPEHLIISAHGGYWARPDGGGCHKVPDWTALHFYGPHKHTLKDPVTGSIAFKKDGKKAKAFEVLRSPVTYHNYKLNEYDGKGADANIEKLLADFEDNADWLKNSKNEDMPSFDVLTIKMKKMSFSPKLKDVLLSLETKNKKYKNIHCLFCRCRLIGPDNAPEGGYEVEYV